MPAVSIYHHIRSRWRRETSIDACSDVAVSGATTWKPIESVVNSGQRCCFCTARHLVVVLTAVGVRSVPLVSGKTITLITNLKSKSYDV